MGPYLGSGVSFSFLVIGFWLIPFLGYLKTGRRQLYMLISCRAVPLLYLSQNTGVFKVELLSSNNEAICDCKTFSGFIMGKKKMLITREIVN